MDSWIRLSDSSFPFSTMFYLGFVTLMLYVGISSMFANFLVLGLIPLTFVVPWWYRFLLEKCAAWGWTLFIICNEMVGRNRIIFYGDNVPKGECVLLVSNHLSNADWMQIFGFAFRKSRLGSIKMQVKKVLQYVPAVGTALHGMGFIFLSRNWVSDEKKLMKGLQSLKKEPKQPFWLLIFPEGHRMSASKLQDSNNFAKKKDLPQMRNVMLPRVKGFYYSYIHLSDSLDAVYDLTIAYNQTPDYFWKLFSGAQRLDCHMLVRRFPIDSLPKDEKGLSEWLYKLFMEKDEKLEDFKKMGRFAENLVEDPLSIRDIKRDLFKWNLLLVGSLSLLYLLLPWMM